MKMDELILEEKFVEFVALTDESIKDLGGIRLSKLDKKTEKKYISELKERLRNLKIKNFIDSF